MLTMNEPFWRPPPEFWDKSERALAMFVAAIAFGFAAVFWASGLLWIIGFGVLSAIFAIYGLYLLATLLYLLATLKWWS